MSDALLQRVQVERQIEATALLAALDDHAAAWMAQALFPNGLEGCQGSEDRVAVVGTATTVEPVVFHYRFPGAQMIRPTDHFRLLVQVPIEQHAAIGVPGQFHEDQRRFGLEDGSPPASARPCSGPGTSPPSASRRRPCSRAPPIPRRTWVTCSESECIATGSARWSRPTAGRSSFARCPRSARTWVDPPCGIGNSIVGH